MMTAGKEVLLQTEPTLGFEKLTYSAVFAHLQSEYDQKVTVGSVHERLWASQREFQLDVIAQLLREPIDPGSHLSLDLAIAAIQEADLTTPQGRRAGIREAVRMSSQFLVPRPHDRALQIAHIVRFRLWALETEHTEAAEIAELLTTIRQSTTEAYINVVGSIMQAVGLRARADAGDPDEIIQAIAVLGNASFIGLRTDVLDVATSTRLIPSGPNGELQQWYPDAVALWAYVQSMLELDGDLTPDERRL